MENPSLSITVSRLGDIENKLTILDLLYDSALETAEEVINILSKSQMSEEDEIVVSPDVHSRRQEAKKAMMTSEAYRDSLDSEMEFKKKCPISKEFSNKCICNTCKEYRKVVGKVALWCVASKSLFVETDDFVNIFGDCVRHFTENPGSADDFIPSFKAQRITERMKAVSKRMQASQNKYLKDF